MDFASAMEELDQARLAKEAGLDGKSRVLARRAAGLAIRAWLETSSPSLTRLSLNNLIKDKQVRQLLPMSLHESLERLITRVDQQYHLPEKFDLVADADQIIKALSNEMEEAK